MKKIRDFVRPIASTDQSEDTTTGYRSEVRFRVPEDHSSEYQRKIPTWERIRAKIEMPEGQEGM